MKNFTFTLLIDNKETYTQNIEAESFEQAEKLWKIMLMLVRRPIKKAQKEGLEISYIYK